MAYILVSDVLQELELSVGPLAEDGRAERLHDLLDRDRRPSQLIFRGATTRRASFQHSLYAYIVHSNAQVENLPDQAESACMMCQTAR